MHFVFSDSKLLKNFSDFQIIQEKDLGGNIVWIHQDKIDVLCRIFHIPAFMWCSALKISLQAAVLIIFRSYKLDKLTLYCRQSICSLLALRLFAIKVSNIAVNFRLEFFLGQAVINKAVNPHLMTVSHRIVRGIFLCVHFGIILRNEE